MTGKDTVSVSGLPDGKYTLTEITAPDGYEVAESIEFEIKNGKVSSEKIEMIDKPISIDFSKTDMAGKEIDGAHLRVLNTLDSNSENSIDEWDSTAGKSHTISGKFIPGVIYCLEETSAPNCFKIADRIYFQVDQYGKLFVSKSMDSESFVSAKEAKITMIDEALSNVKIRKVDAVNGEQLEGATLQITKKDNSKINISDVKVTDSADKAYAATVTEDKISFVTPKENINVSGLPDGVYTLTEITAPDGYDVAEAIDFEIKDGKVVDSDTVTMKDSRKAETTTTPASTATTTTTTTTTTQPTTTTTTTTTTQPTTTTTTTTTTHPTTVTTTTTTTQPTTTTNTTTTTQPTTTTTTTTTTQPTTTTTTTTQPTTTTTTTTTTQPTTATTTTTTTQPTTATTTTTTTQPTTATTTTTTTQPTTATTTTTTTQPTTATTTTTTTQPTTATTTTTTTQPTTTTTTTTTQPTTTTTTTTTAKPISTTEATSTTQMQETDSTARHTTDDADSDSNSTTKTTTTRDNSATNDSNPSTSTNVKDADETTAPAVTTEYVTTPKPYNKQVNPPRYPEYTTVATVPAPAAPARPSSGSSGNTPSTGEHVNVIPFVLLFASVGIGTGAWKLRKRDDDED